MTTTSVSAVQKQIRMVTTDSNEARSVVRERRVDVSEHFVALANRLISLRRGPGTGSVTTAELANTAGTLSSKAVGITSCGTKGGASTVAANVAIATSAAVGGEVLLIETTPRRRSRVPGWAEVLRGQVALDDALIHSDVEGLVRLHPGEDLGPLPVDPVRVKQLIESLKERFEFIFFDLPPANELTQCYPIASVLDGVVLVVRANKVSTPQAIRASKELEQAGAHLVGAVLNQKRRCVPAFLRRLLPFLSEPES